MEEIEDLAGVRIITFFPITTEQVKVVIHEEFLVSDEQDKADLLMKEEKFGYQSVHYIVSLKPARFILPEYAIYKNLKAEIQVRTVLQHAWAEIEHDIQYKSLESAP